MSGLRTDPASLDGAADGVSRCGDDVHDAASALESRCLSVPRVGDLPAAAAFGQAHYDWTQTRFEDLSASAAGLSDAATRLHSAARAYREQDEAGATGLIVSAADAAGALR